jgi:NADPH:quinone reductase-like Zn-dependent oxidoreductase
MKAITQDRYGSAEVLALDDIAMPVAGDDEVLIRVRAAGVGPDVWHLMTGLPYFVRLMGAGQRPASWAGMSPGPSRRSARM